MASQEDPLGTERRFAVNLRQFRERAGMSQSAVAEGMQDLGFRTVHQQTIDRFEKQAQRPRLGQSHALAMVLGTTLAMMLQPPELAGEAWLALTAARDVRAAARAAEEAARRLAGTRSHLKDAIARAEEKSAAELAPEISLGRAALKDTGELMSGHIDDRWYKGKGRHKSESASHGRGLRWRVRYIDSADIERSKSFEYKDDAEQFLTEVKASLLQGNYINPQRGKMTLRAYAEQWLKAQTFEATTRERVDQRLRLHILPGLGDRTLTSLAQSPSTIQAWLRGLKGPDDRPLAAGHVQTILANLSGILGAAMDDGRIVRNPCAVKSVKAPKIVRAKIVPWRVAEITAAREALPERYRVLADIGAMLGLRQGEAFGLAVEDIEFMKRVVHVKRQVRIVGSKLCFAPPKGGKERDVPLSDLASLRISAHLQRFPATKVTLPWKDPAGKPVTAALITTTTARKALDRAYFHRLWRAAREKAGKPNERENGFHSLRHYFASAQLTGGTDIKAVSEYLGHHDPGFTLRVYAHLMHGAADRARKAIDEAFAEPSNGPDTAPAASR